MGSWGHSRNVAEGVRREIAAANSPLCEDVNHELLHLAVLLVVAAGVLALCACTEDMLPQIDVLASLRAEALLSLTRRFCRTKANDVRLPPWVSASLYTSTAASIFPLWHTAASQHAAVRVRGKEVARGARGAESHQST